MLRGGGMATPMQEKGNDDENIICPSAASELKGFNDEKPVMQRT